MKNIIRKIFVFGAVMAFLGSQAVFAAEQTKTKTYKGPDGGTKTQTITRTGGSTQ